MELKRWFPIAGMGVLGLVVGIAAWVNALGAEEVQKIPLESIYSTNGQKGLKPMNRGFHPQADGTKKWLIRVMRI
jgi:hypothetical protein